MIKVSDCKYREVLDKSKQRGEVFFGCDQQFLNALLMKLKVIFCCHCTTQTVANEPPNEITTLAFRVPFGTRYISYSAVAILRPRNIAPQRHFESSYLRRMQEAIFMEAVFAKLAWRAGSVHGGSWAQVVFYMPNEEVLKKDDLSRELCFVLYGACHLIEDDKVKRVVRHDVIRRAQNLPVLRAHP